MDVHIKKYIYFKVVKIASAEEDSIVTKEPHGSITLAVLLFVLSAAAVTRLLITVIEVYKEGEVWAR